MLNRKVEHFKFCRFDELFMVNHEYDEGFFMVVRPVGISRNIFYPYRKNATCVKIVLEDGERLMDRLLFRTLYKFSRNPAPGVFSESSEGEGIPMPFTVKEFDEYMEFLIAKRDSNAVSWESERFLSYLKITHFLMPVAGYLYAEDSIPINFLDQLDVPLDLFPPRIIEKIVWKCDLRKYGDHPVVVKMIYDNHRWLADLGWYIKDQIVSLFEPTIKSLGLDFDQFKNKTAKLFQHN